VTARPEGDPEEQATLPTSAALEKKKDGRKRHPARRWVVRSGPSARLPLARASDRWEKKAQNYLALSSWPAPDLVSPLSRCGTLLT